MNEKELGRALLNLDAANRSRADARALTDRIVARDRRRVRGLIGLTVVSWLAAAALFVLVMVEFGFLFPKEAKLRLNLEQGTISAEKWAKLRELHLDVFQKATFDATMAVGALAVASLCTLGLVVATRRATLRQVNANLVEITEQLKQMRHGPQARRECEGPLTDSH